MFTEHFAVAPQRVLKIACKVADQRRCGLSAVQHPDPVQVPDFQQHKHAFAAFREGASQLFKHHLVVSQSGGSVHGTHGTVIHHIPGKHIRFPVPAVVKPAAAGYLDIFPVLVFRPVTAEMILFPACYRSRQVRDEFLAVVRMDMFRPDRMEIVQEFSFQAEIFHHGRRHAGYVGFHIGQVGIVFLAGQAHGVKHPVCQAGQVHVRSRVPDPSLHDFPFQVCLVAVHHVVRHTQHIPQAAVFRIGDCVAHSQFRNAFIEGLFFPAGFLDAFDIPDDDFLLHFPVDCQELVSAHAVDMLRLLQAVRQEHRHMADIVVAFLLAVQTVHLPEVADVDKQEDEPGVPVRFKFPVVRRHIALVAGPGTQAAQRIHHDFSFQHSCGAFQREEKPYCNCRHCTVGKQEFFDIGLDRHRHEKQHQRRQHNSLEVPADLFPVNHDTERG